MAEGGGQVVHTPPPPPPTSTSWTSAPPPPSSLQLPPMAAAGDPCNHPNRAAHELQQNKTSPPPSSPFIHTPRAAAGASPTPIRSGAMYHFSPFPADPFPHPFFSTSPSQALPPQPPASPPSAGGGGGGFLGAPAASPPLSSSFLQIGAAADSVLSLHNNHLLEPSCLNLCDGGMNGSPHLYDQLHDYFDLIPLAMQGTTNTLRRPTPPGAAESCTNQEVGAGAGGAAAMAAGARVVRYTAEERKERIERYRSKRNHRNFHKKITYACRKTLADSRPRVRGRFARNGEADAAPEAGEVSNSCNNSWTSQSGACGGGGEYCCSRGWRTTSPAAADVGEYEYGSCVDPEDFNWASFLDTMISI